jgi:hypothetical protein
MSLHNPTHSVFFARLCVFMAGLVILSTLSSFSVFGQTPEEIQIQSSDTKNTTLSGSCDGLLRIEKTHEIDFGSFNTSEVAG